MFKPGSVSRLPEQRCTLSERTLSRWATRPGRRAHERGVAAMLIQLHIDTTQPLMGTATGASQRTVAFVGWLDLLRAVSELTDAGTEPAEPDDHLAPVLLDARRDRDARFEELER